MMAPYISAQKLVLLTEHKVVNAAVEKDEVRSVNVKNLRNKQTVTLSGSYFVDATELGDLLPLTGTEYVTGTESKAQTNELHAPDKDPRITRRLPCVLP